MVLPLLTFDLALPPAPAANDEGDLFVVARVVADAEVVVVAK